MFLLISTVLSLSCCWPVTVTSQGISKNENPASIISYCVVNDGCKECNPLDSIISLNVSCTYLDKRIPCQEAVPAGTVAQVKCKDVYFPSNATSFVNETICLSNGTWSNTLHECIPNCGEPKLSVVETLVSHGQIAQPKEFPWHAGVYWNVNDVWTQICGGTIVSSHVVITAAHCVYNEKSGAARNPAEIKVGVGKYIRTWEVPEPHSQRRKVRGIYLSPYYRGKKTNYERDLAILDLYLEVEFNDYVVPICMDWSRSLNVENGELGTVVGWGLSRNDLLYDNLRYIRLPQLKFNECLKKSTRLFLKYITPDKFCAGYLNGTGVQQGDSGCSLTLPKAGKYFLRGLVSVKPSKNDSFGVFTDIMDLSHTSWINQTVSRLSARYKAQSKYITRRGECLLPEKYDGLNFTVQGCSAYNISSQCLGEETVPVSNGTEITLFCEEGYEADSNNTNVICDNGVWSPQPLSCRKQCSSLNLEYSRLRCRYKKKIIPCPDKYFPTFMIVSQSCFNGYKIPLSSNNYAWCQEDGQWTNLLKSCVPACGKPNSNTSLTYLHKHPWKVGIYLIHPNETEEFLCSGVRLLGLLVMTAADCVAFEETQTTIKASSLKVTGSIQVDWDSQDLLLNWKVVRVMVPKDYNGKYSKYENNVALLALKSVDLGSGRTMSACYDKKLKPNKTIPKHGVVVSWKGSEEEIEMQDNEVIDNDVEIIGPQDCFAKYPSARSFLTWGKFCIEKAAGQNLNGGSSLLVKKDIGYFIQGIKVTNHNQTNEDVWVFTNVTQVNSWINKVAQLQLLETILNIKGNETCKPPEKYSSEQWCES